MNVISLKQAVTQIKQACIRIDENQRTPFFFVVGAGISHPSVPLASSLVSEFKNTAFGYGILDEPQGKRAIDEYSHWFDQAYPQRIDRQRFLRRLIKARAISPANLRLAHLLLSKRISNLVVTTNFDDFLSRALLLFGSQHIVCDHPKTVQRIDPEEHIDIQIVHVHGTYWFYDCCNLTGEIEDRAQDHDDIYTMGALLDQILYRRSPLIIGYGGWEGDVFMTALERRLNQSNLPRRIYWFCYRRQNLDSLPDWLTSHQDVYFVLPDEERNLSGSERSAETSSRAEGSVALAPDTSSKRSDTSEPSLSARYVFDALIKALEPSAPELTSDPLRFFAKQLKSSLPIEDLAADESDIYFMTSVLERVERAMVIEAAQQTKTDASQSTEALIETVRDSVRRSQYKEAISQIAAISNDRLGEISEKHLRELMSASWSSAQGLFDHSKEELEAYDLVIAIGDALSSRGHQESGLREAVANAIFYKGYNLRSSNRREDAIASYDEVVSRFGNATEPALREPVANAIVSKGSILSSLNRHEEALALYDEVVSRFGHATEPALREPVARALFQRAMALGALNRQEEAIAAYDEVIRCFGDATEPTVRDLVAGALYNKGIALGAQHHNAEAIAVLKEVVSRFGEANEPRFREHVVRALNSLGFRMICQAKELWVSGDEQSARETLAKAREKLDTAYERQPENPILLGNLGYATFLLDKKEEATAFLTQAIALGGEKIREAELVDADISPLPQDHEFRELVRSIPSAISAEP